ncbi:hypothetical protein J5N97_025692 [Dioscorea zingiberensis]|uniref:Uncharacterized protein n=1 Tax=Dioscorea zingiberensis TaxID=325984 RepID=A0A9D5C243_9LILI|nr:hypothetical protein J5N97_025692 [Dioscorea zingiberensis]
MALSSWLCANNTRNMVVKIVYPGGRVELRDRPIIAAEIMKANPMCCVAHPDVFRQPWSVVSPETVLMQGQKFYVVPVRTIRKLRHLHQKNTTSLNSPPGLTQRRNSPLITSSSSVHVGHSGNSFKRLCGLRRHSEDDDGCFTCLISRAKVIQQQKLAENGISYNIEEPQSKLEEMNRRRMKRSVANASPCRSVSNWQPSLQSISEE